MIDLHCHALPGIDDGPANVADAIGLISKAAEEGVATVVATPHVSYDWPNDAQRIQEQVDLLNDELARRAIGVHVVAGAEIAASQVAHLEPAALDGLTLGTGPWLLMECPLGSDAGFEQVLRGLQGQRYEIVLAHPERCPAFIHDPERLYALISRGMLTSVTASAFAGRFGTPARRLAVDLARRGLVHNIASDAHDAVRRPPGLLDGVKRAGLMDQADLLTRAVPEAILTGAPIPELPPRREGLIARMRGRAHGRAS